MQRIIKWLKREIQQSITSEADQRNAGATTERKSKDEFSYDSSLNWFGIDQADSSIFDFDSLITEEPEDKDGASHTTPILVCDSLSDASEDAGVDPYKTGRFDTAKK